MYQLKNYISRGSNFINNKLFPGNKKLSTLMIYATDLCDSGCKHCLIWAKRPVVHLPLEKIKELLASKCVSKRTTVGLEGGEFLLHPQAMEILEYLYTNHPNFDLLSNCLKPEKVVEAVKKYPPKRLYVSLDGDRDSYLYMRGKDGYDNVLYVIEQLKDIVPISTMFTLSPYNDFEDMRHVAEVCKKYGVDMRIGVYNDIAFFDTVEKAHETDIGTQKNDQLLKFKDVKKIKEEGLLEKNKALKESETVNLVEPKHDEQKIAMAKSFKENIPSIVKEFKENYDYLVLYDEWRQKKLNLKCNSILDSVIVLPNGDVPICQNLETTLGNIYENSLDEVFNGPSSQEMQHDHVHNCNQCWVSFHRKYDVVLYRTFEKFFSRGVTNKLFGYYQWEEDSKSTYNDYMKKVEREYS